MLLRHWVDFKSTCSFRATASLLPEDAYLSPTAGRIFNLNAYVDFVLHPQMWALELLVDGRNLKEHEKR